MTLADLLKLFRWFDKNGEPFPLNSELDLPHKEIPLLQAEIQANLSSEAPQPEELLSDISKFLQQLSERNEAFNVYKSSIHWLIDLYPSLNNSKIHQHRSKQKIGSLFKNYLDSKPDEAISFYRTELQLQQINPNGTFIIQSFEEERKATSEIRKIDDYIGQMTEKLAELKNPLSLILYMDYTDINSLAACIIWLRRRGVCESTILKSGVLQKFFLHNLHLVTETENPIKDFYDCLAERPEAEMLVNLASAIRVDDPTFKKYNLKAEVDVDKEFETLPISSPDFTADYDSDLFMHLYDLFGMSFLYRAFQNCHDHQGQDDGVLQAALNLEGIAFEALPELIRLLLNSHSEGALERRLETLAELVSREALLRHLVTNKQWLMFYLLCSKEMEEVFTLDAFILYIQEFISLDAVDPINKFRLLFFLLQWAKVNELPYHIHYLFRQLVALYYQAPPEVFNHEYEKALSREYKQIISTEESSESEADGVEDVAEDTVEEDSDSDMEVNHSQSTVDFITNIVLDFENNWEAFSSNLLSGETVDSSDYQKLKDGWREVEKKRGLARRFDKTEDNEPSLEEFIISKRFSLRNYELVLDELLLILFDLSQDKELYNCQQVLIRVLFKLDIPPLREQIIKVLTQTNRHWFLVSWRILEGTSILEEAVKHNNLGLTQELMNQLELDPFDDEVYFKVLMSAIKAKNLVMLKLLVRPQVISKLNEGQLRELYTESLNKDTLLIFEFLLSQHELLSLRPKTHSTLILEAAKKGFGQALSQLCGPQSPFHADAELIDKALMLAIENKHWKCIDELIQVAGPSFDGLLDGWIVVLQKYTWEEQERFIQLYSNYFTRKMIWKAVQHYMDNANLPGITLLLEIKGEPEVTAADLVEVFRVVVANKSWPEFALYLSKITGPGALTREAVAEAITEIIVPESNHEMLTFIYDNFRADLLPDSTTVGEIFRLAAGGKFFEIIKLLCDRSAQDLDNDVLIKLLAIEQQEPESQLREALTRAVDVKQLVGTEVGGIFEGYVDDKNKAGLSTLLQLKGQLALTADQVEVALYECAVTGQFGMASILIDSPQLKEKPGLIATVFEFALPQKQNKFIVKLAKKYTLSSEENIRFLADLIDNEQYETLQEFCRADPELWTWSFQKAVELNKSSAVNFICHSKRFRLVSNWTPQLEQVLSEGRLEQVKAIVSAVASRTPEALNVDNYKQLARENGHAPIVDWFEQLKALKDYRQVSSYSSFPLLKAQAILKDYTKSDSAIKRFFTGHWNRHHVDEVSLILQSRYKSLEELLARLSQIDLLNPKGSLARRIIYMADFLLPLEKEAQREEQRAMNGLAF
ncbi:Ankyrin repeats (3 copies) [Legionella massiliensis]|uniref:Ankyrin repeats (3 copies) n=2 Tax=Legionella massiliensis TaxID=1034943 RepID=A0A078KZN4_9GAMM|nr:Ankyrin repeats (3 copies) [Legionella massiliensis]CEE14175.1 Ankyrin repeats (3 copies) [Legionella massiliensis]